MTTTFITGPMFAGKSTLLHAKLKTADNPILICPKIDSRDTDVNYLWTHNGKKPISCEKVITPSLLDVDIADYDNIFISEGQFFGNMLCDFIKKYHGYKNIICDGLITDYQQRLFGKMFQLSHEYPDIVIHNLTGKCHNCGNPSQYTIRKTGDTGLIIIGSSQYETSCAECLFKN